MKKAEVRPYLQSLAGITPYVEAVIALECFDVAAVPMDTKLLLWLIAKDILPEGLDIRAAQTALEKHLKIGDMLDFHRGARKEINDWTPKIWPAVLRAYSPVLAPPPVNAQGDEIRTARRPLRPRQIQIHHQTPRPRSHSCPRPPQTPRKIHLQERNRTKNAEIVI